MPLVRIGRLGRPHGVAGEMTLDGASLTAPELEAVRRYVWRGRDGAERPLVLRGARPVHGRVLVAFDGAPDREAAAALTPGELWAESDRLPDPGPQVAYTFQLVGLAVETEDGRALGTLAEVLSTGAHPVYVVRGERELLVPAVPEVLKRVDLAARRIVVALPPGLEEI
jgi:16S rRNA processing protein RimM